MKILFDYQAFSRNSYGGVSRYYIELYLHLLSQKVDANILAPIHRNMYLNTVSSDGVWGRYLRSYPPKTTSLILKINQLISAFLIPKISPNVIHSTYYANHPYRIRSASKILTVYDMIHELIPGELSPGDRTSDLKAAAVRDADHIICISENTKSDLIRFLDVPESKISVVYLGCDPGGLGLINTIQPFVNHKPYLLYVGNRFGYKNFKVLLQAFGALKLYKSHDLFLFGGGGLSREELSMLVNLNIPLQNIQCISGGDHLLISLYRGAEVFVYPSIHEGFGLPPLEAMNNFCPVISSSSSCMPEILGDAALYFDPMSYEDLMITLMRVISSNEDRQNYILKGVERASLFTWKSCGDATLEIYKRFC